VKAGFYFTKFDFENVVRRFWVDALLESWNLLAEVSSQSFDVLYGLLFLKNVDAFSNFILATGIGL